MAKEQSLFAQELNARLASSSLSVDEVLRELQKRGFSVPQRTFSYWLQGYFLPRSEAAFQLVGVMESVLGVADTSLLDALLADLSSDNLFVPGENVQKELSTPPATHNDFSSDADDVTDWEATVVQKVVHDNVVVSADMKKVIREATIFARIPPAPNPSFSFQVAFEDGFNRPGREDVFYDVSGMTLKKCDVFRENNYTVYAVHFLLPDDVAPGDLHKLSFKIDEEASNEPFDAFCYRFLPWSLDFYSCNLTFEGGIPEGIRYVTCENRGGEDVEVPNNIPLVRKGNMVSMSVKNFGNIIGYFEIPESASQ